MTKPKRDIQAGMAVWLERKKAEKLKARSRQYDSKRVQFLGVQTDVLALLDQGYSRRSLWEYLTEEGLLDLTYESFCRHIRNRLGKRSQKPPPMPRETALVSSRIGTAQNIAQATPEPSVAVSAPVQTKPKPKKLLVPVSSTAKEGFSFDPRPPDPSLFERGDE